MAIDSQRLIEEGRKLLDRGEAARATVKFASALKANPGDLGVIELLARAQYAAGKIMPALQNFDVVIRSGKATPETWFETGNALGEVREYAQSLGAFEKAIEGRHDYPEAHHNLARACFQLGELERMEEHLRIAASQTAALDPALGLAVNIPAFPGATNSSILAARQNYARRLAEHSPLAQRPRPSKRSHGGKPRIGYVSSWFHVPNYMKPVWALMNNHDRERFEIHLLSDTGKQKTMTGYERHDDDVLHDTSKLSNAQLAELIEDLEIDILVDLNGVATPERLELFLSPLAPVVVHWFNCYATTGFPGVDYIVGDAEAVKDDEDVHYSEKVIRLPLSYITFTVGHRAPEVVSPPCLDNGHLTFGSLVTLYKITTPVVESWARILREVPDSRLLLANTATKSIHNQQFTRERFEKAGADPDRLVFLPPAKHFEYLKYYDQIDIALDAFPYNGGTTTTEAIWQGVPVLTFDGDRWASRTSQTLLRRCHLGEFVTDDAETMTQQAIDLARDPKTPKRLADLRRDMRETLSQSSVCDAPALAQAMEQFYESVLVE